MFRKTVFALLLTAFAAGSICMAEASEPVIDSVVEVDLGGDEMIPDEYAPEDYGSQEPATNWDTYKMYEDVELDLVGSTGYPAFNMPLLSSAADGAGSLCTMTAGTPFRILGEVEKWWMVDYQGTQGYVPYLDCFLNLPDVLPDIDYCIANASNSIYTSSGVGLPGVTGMQLYEAGKVWNERLGREEYIVPLQYTAARMLAAAYSFAKIDGYNFRIYDSYRPHSVTIRIRDSLASLYDGNERVRDGINYSYDNAGNRYYWNQGWFLAQGVSSHNVGAAVDITLVDMNTGEEPEMPSAMHELSTAAVKYNDGDEKKVPANYCDTMTEAAARLDRYFSVTGMSTLASEWWHFQDQEGYVRMRNLTGGCDFQVTEIVSVP